MTRARKTCSTPRCPHLQPCPEHAPKPWAGSDRRSRLPGNWDSLRRRVLARDPICTIQLVCEGSLSTVCDHRIPGDDHRLENLQGICSACDRVKSSQEGNAAKHGRRTAA